MNCKARPIKVPTSFPLARRPLAEVRNPRPSRLRKADQAAPQTPPVLAPNGHFKAGEAVSGYDFEVEGERVGS